MVRGREASVGVLAVALLASPILAAEEAVPSAALFAVTEIGTVPHTAESVEVDGVLSEPFWDDALVVELDTETFPRENLPAPVATFVRVVENGSHLLIAFDARDPEPEKIRAYLSDRDSSFNDDFIGVVLDTFNDQRRAFEFFVNPFGVQMDLTMDDVNGGEDTSWNAIWDSAGQITAEGYVVEVAIPFSQLRFQRTDGPQTWGFEAVRYYPREDRIRLAPKPRERGRNCYLCQLDKVSGFASVEPGKGLEVVPSVTASRSDERDAALGQLVEGDSDSEVGMNVRWAFTPDLIANFALNPDFSQVEADVPQLDVNNQFAVFYPERRPFFLEGANFFEAPINAVFTRTVADPDFGAKLTGTSSKNTYGLFAAEDAVTNLLFPGAFSSSSRSLDQSNTAFVGRYQRGFGANSAVGALVTTREGDGYHNYVAGFDGRYRMNANNSLSFNYLGSDTEYPAAIVAQGQPAGSFTGDALQLNYNYGTREWGAFANYRSFDTGFRADSGFVSQVDVVNNNVGFNRQWHGDGSQWWNQFRVGANTGSSHTQAGQLIGRWQETFINVEGPRQMYAETGLSQNRRYWNGQYYDLRSLWAYSQARPRGGLNMGLQMSMGDEIDFTNSRLADQVLIGPWLGWNVNRHLLVNLEYTTEQLDDAASGDRIYDANVMDLRFTWQFSARAFLRLTQQQRHTDRNVAMYTDPNTDARSDSRATQLLYSYQLNPQTVFYAGYSNNEMRDDQLTELTETGRTFFLKFSYAWIP
ncbi:MAG TPA: DUF5916 domain-containing protein [Gammaproteobacteria bacterium]